MRQAAIDDAWRHALGQIDDRPWIEKLSISSLEGFLDQEIEVRSAIALFCGPNASGKSRLIRAVRNSSEDQGDPTVEVTYSDGGMAATSIVHLDLFALTSMHLQSIVGDHAIGDRIDQAGEFNKLSPRELAGLNWLLGLEYESLEFVELEATSAIDEASSTESSTPIFRPEAVPYFRAQRRRLTYSSAEASRGELAAWTLFWALKTLESGSLVLIDEPEMFLSPHSAARVVDYVAVRLENSRSSALIASHSPNAVLRAPVTCRFVLQDAEQGISSRTGTVEELWTVLRIAQSACIVIAVEDYAGQKFAELLLAHSDYRHRNITSIWNARGDGNVLNAARMPRNPESLFHIYGLLDGDARGGPGDRRPNVSFLPGTTAPEDFVLRTLEAGPELFSSNESLHASIQGAIASTLGEDVHERLQQIASAIGSSFDHLIQTVLANWLATASGQRYLEEFKPFVDGIQVPARRQ